MKKWLLALMICLSFSTLTAGLFLLPQTINAVYQREQEAERDKKAEENASVITTTYEWSSTAAVRTITLSMNGKTASNSPTTTFYANSLYNAYMVIEDNGGFIPIEYSVPKDDLVKSKALKPGRYSLGNIVHFAKISLSGYTYRSLKAWNNDDNITLPTVSGYSFSGFWSASSGGTQYISATGSLTSAGSNSVSYGASGSTTWYAQWASNNTELCLYPDSSAPDSETIYSSTWLSSFTLQVSPSGKSQWKSVASSYSNPGAHYFVPSGWDVRFTASCKSGYAVWKITHNGNRVWPDASGYYTITSLNTNTSGTYYCYPVAGYKVSVTASTGGTVQHQTSSPKMASISGGVKTGKTVYISGANWWVTDYSTYVDFYARPDTGYAFSSWSSTTTGTITAARSLTAYFTGLKYALTLNPNGSTGGTTSNQTVYAKYMSSSLYANSTVTDTTAASITAPTRTGYTFGGWVTSSGVNQTGTVIINSSGALQASTSYTNASRQWTSTSSRTLYAKWTANRYAVTLNVNGATSGTTKTIYAQYGSSTLYSASTGTTTASITNPTKTHNTFAGWSTSNSSSSGTIVINTSKALTANNGYTNSSDQWTSTSAPTLYARWTANDITWHFMFEGGVSSDGGSSYANSFGAASESGFTCKLDINFGSAHGECIELWFNDRESFLLDIDQGGNGSFSLYADVYYRFTGLYYVDWGNDGEEYSPSPHTYEEFSVDDGAYDDVYIYFEMEKVLYVQSNNTSYGTVNVSEVWVPCIDNFSVTTSGKTATINDTTATAIQKASTTGFTYAFGSWTWLSPLYPGYAITANFTRTTNTRSVTLAVRTISKSGGVSSSNAIPSGASIAVSYTNSTPSSTSSSQTSASTAYTIQAGTSMTITPTVPAGYKYVGYNTSASKPSVSSFPTSSTITPANGSTYYFFFQEVAAPLYYTTERGGYWYYEDGEYPQTYVGTSLSGTSATSSKFNINGTDYTVYTANGLKYIQVASPMTGTIKFNGTTVSLTKGTKYWFRVDPIRWRVSKYGKSASDFSLSSVEVDFVGVSDILGHGRVNTNASITDTQNMTNAYQDCEAVGYANASTKIWRDMYTYQEGKSKKVNSHSSEVNQENKLLVASPDIIRNVVDDSMTYASDLSAMLQCRDYNNATGWTSGMYNLGSGIVVGPGASYMGKYWANTDNVFGFVYAHQASYATCLGTR